MGAINGEKALRRRLALLVERLPIATAIRLDNAAQLIRGRAVAIAPELTRKLILSSKVTKRDSQNRAIRVVSFDTDYAVVRHEDFYELGPISSAKSPTQDGPPGRKYLERPFKKSLKEIQRDIGKVPEAEARKVVTKVRDTERC